MGAGSNTPRPPQAWHDLLRRLRQELGWRLVDLRDALRGAGYRPKTANIPWLSRLERESVPAVDALVALSRVYRADLITAYAQALGVRPGGSPLASVQTEHGENHMIIEGILTEIPPDEIGDFMREVLAIAARYKRRTHRGREAKSKSGP